MIFPIGFDIQPCQTFSPEWHLLFWGASADVLPFLQVNKSPGELFPDFISAAGFKGQDKERTRSGSSAKLALGSRGFLISVGFGSNIAGEKLKNHQPREVSHLHCRILHLSGHGVLWDGSGPGSPDNPGRLNHPQMSMRGLNCSLDTSPPWITAFRWRLWTRDFIFR